MATAQIPRCFSQSAMAFNSAVVHLKRRTGWLSRSDGTVQQRLCVRLFCFLRGIALSAQRVRNGLRERTDLPDDPQRLFIRHGRDVDGSVRLMGFD